MRKTSNMIIILAVAAFCFMPVQSSATVITFNYYSAFSGTAPEGSTPWLTAIFDDFDSTGFVQLTIAATNLTNSEFIDSLYFNFNPSLDLSSLSIDFSSGQSAESILQSTDSYKADGIGGYFDILFNFPQSANLDRFVNNDTTVFTFSLTGLTANDFSYLSTEDYPSAAHVQSIGDGLSGWVAGATTPAPVPEPATMLLIGSGLLGLAGFRNKTR